MKGRNVIYEDNTNGLKGQHNLAQGLAVSIQSNGFGVSAQSNGNALGCETGNRIVRAITFFEGLLRFRTKRIECKFRPKRGFYPDYGNNADGFRCISFTPGDAWGWDKPTFQAATRSRGEATNTMIINTIIKTKR